ncbi:MAG: malonyl CoA-acyl carrier protein transacylase [Candidatus Makaraimicrobium thalassicum]|nr:MAG: malonyl CoA-acyl carrier protein transacylase [Candidatus Omnitrophota bacterium]
MLNGKYGLLFPGQGAQTAGMGKELYQTQPAARWVFNRANEVLERDIAKLCFEGPEDQLQTTANSQPAIFTVSIAALNVLIEKLKGGPVGEEDREIFSAEDIKSVGALAMGLSLGEPTALVAAGALSFEDGLRFVEKRGLFMEEASQKQPGKMASIMGLELDKVEELCMGLGCQVANLNCPGQVVISGHAGRVELAADLAKNQGARRVIMLKVGGAFHSDLMTPAKEKLEAVLSGMEVREPVIDFISNINAEVTKDPAKIKSNLMDQLDNRTLWEASVRKAASLGVTDYLEIGPGSVLKGLLKKIDPTLTVISIADALSNPM